MKTLSNIASFKMSKLLGETPYVKEAVKFYYNSSGYRCNDPSGMLTINAKYPAPSLGEILDWLRVNYKQVIIVLPKNNDEEFSVEGEGTWYWRRYENCLNVDRPDSGYFYSEKSFKLYPDALIEGITDALEKLKE